MILTNPKVSVLMIVYNSYDFVRSENNDFLSVAISSILSQTFDDFELIILDNQSTDQTQEICRRFEKEDDRIRFIIDREQRFPEAAIEECFNYAKGDYVMIANDDDLWDQDYIKDLASILDLKPSIDFAYTNGRYIDIYNNLEGKIIENESLSYANDNHPLSNFCLYTINRNPVPINFGLFRYEAFKKALPFENFDELKANVDNLFTSRLFLRGLRSFFLDKEYFFYRVKQRSLNPEKVSGMPSLKKPLDILVYYLTHQINYYKQIIAEIDKLKFHKPLAIYLKQRTILSLLNSSEIISFWVYENILKDLKLKLKVRKCFFRLHTLGVELKELSTHYAFIEIDLNESQFNLFVQESNFKTLEGKKQILTAILEDLSPFIEDKKSLENLKSAYDFEFFQLSHFLKTNRKVETNAEFRPRRINNSPRVSVIVCSYNLKKFLRSTLTSVFSQDNSSYEVIVIDGNSTDGSVELLDTYENIVFLAEDDSGYPEAFWKGINLAKGEYIIQCAVSDCLANSSWIGKAIDFLDKHKEISLVWGLPQYLSEEGDLGKVSFPQFHLHKGPSRDEFYEYWLLSSFIFPEGNLCVRKEVLTKCYPPFDKIPIGELDWLIFNYNFNYKGYLSHYIPIVANFGRHHGNQMSENLLKIGQMERMWNAYSRKVVSLRYKTLFRVFKPKFLKPDDSIANIKFNYNRFLYSFVAIFIQKIWIINSIKIKITEFIFLVRIFKNYIRLKLR